MRFGGIVLVTALTLGACSSDPGPKQPEPSATTATTAPAAALPTKPPQASEDSAEGAAAFVAYYVEVFNYAAATGDVDELIRLSDPTCDACQRYASRFEQIYAKGDRIAERLWTLGTEDLLISGSTRVTAVMNVNEGATKQYNFNFDLSPTNPFKVAAITMKDDS